jgi:hypothetical protein
MKRLTAVICLLAALGTSACNEDEEPSANGLEAAGPTVLERLASLPKDRGGARTGTIIYPEASMSRRLVGLSLARAEQFAERAGATLRVVRRDGVHVPYTGDFRQDRVNVAVRGAEIARVVGIF